jgi:hypothetical protein
LNSDLEEHKGTEMEIAVWSGKNLQDLLLPFLIDDITNMILDYGVFAFDDEEWLNVFPPPITRD